jgi:hypothetical protein
MAVGSAAAGAVSMFLGIILGRWRSRTEIKNLKDRLARAEKRQA